MENLTIIAAIGKNRELGKNNQLIWNIKEDLKFFKEQTMGKTLVMGLNTFNSLPGLLPGRKHVVLTSKNIFFGDDVLVLHSLEELFNFIKYSEEEIMIIGGARVYSEIIPYVDKMILTEINASDEECDVYFPNFRKDDFEQQLLCSHENNSLEYKHMVYTRKK